MDYWGNSRTDFDSDPIFYSETTFSTAGRGPATTRPNPNSPGDYPGKGEWLIAFQDRWFSDAPGYLSTDQDLYIDAMGDIWGGPDLWNETVWWYPIKFGTNVYSQAQRDTSWTNLLSWIASPWVRNFYYQGHGNGSAIGCDRQVLDTNGLIIGGAMTSRYSKSELFAWQVAQKIRNNRYRFAFLDGCSTTSGNWPAAFSVSKTTHDLSFYENDQQHRRPSVFVGWAEDTGGEATVYHWLDFEGDWMANWVDIYSWVSIKDALEWADVDAKYLDLGRFRQLIRVYGYQDMGMLDYNRASDWTRP